MSNDVQIVYAHGFRDATDSAESQKGTLLHEKLSAITPDLPMEPLEAVKVLRHQIDAISGPVALVGHSLGGFYATHLSQTLGLPAVLTNPIVNPAGSPLLVNILWETPDLIPVVQVELKSLECDITHPDNLLVMLQKADESLDYRQALEHYKDCNQVILNGGSHKWDNFEYWLPIVEWFFDKHYGGRHV